jgi:hypothetical protein
MLQAFKRWISGSSSEVQWGGLAAWVRQKNWDFKRVRQDGFVIEGIFDAANDKLPWRLEWGASERDYIQEQELRMCIDLQLPDDLQMMALSRPLMEQLERAAYEQFTNTSQTFVGSSAPEEMRWLSMFSKVATADRSLRSRFAVVANEPVLGASWVGGTLSEELALAGQTWLLHEPAFVLMTLRGRLYLRLACAAPDPALLERVVHLFLTAARHADRVAQASSGPASTDEWPSTATSAWQAQLDEAEDRPEGDRR